MKKERKPFNEDTGIEYSEPITDAQVAAILLVAAMLLIAAIYGVYSLFN